MAGKLPATKQPSPATNYYLILYNTFSCLGWGYVLVTTYLHLTGVHLTGVHLTGVHFPGVFGSTPGRASAFSFQTLIEHVRELLEELIRETIGLLTPSNNAFGATMIPLQLIQVYNRMVTTYDVVGSVVAVVQTAAALEIIHSVIGLVKSPLPTVVIQVYSRLFLVWGVTQKYGQSSHSALYSTMILAWSTTEVIRYAFYALSLVRRTVPGVLVYLRYTTFYLLYPLGASSEALLILSSLPATNPLEGFKTGAWNSWDYFRGVMFVVWWPGLLVMMSHMVKQRGKVYGRSAGNTKVKSS